MSRRRIVVTGLGCITPLGQDVDSVYESLLQGKSGVKPITTFACDDLSTRFAASVSDFNPEGYVEKKLDRRIDRFISFALYAGKRAVESADINLSDTSSLDSSRCGILIGSGIGGIQKFQEGVNVLEALGPKKVTPFFIPFILTNMAGGLLAIELNFMGPNYSVSSACATGNHAIALAADHIRKGEADLMVCGGVEAAVTRVGLAGFCACRALSKRNDEPERASRPWDRGRDGFVLGEGAGVLVLESLEHAEKRGAPILAEYLGAGISCDAHHITNPREDGKGIALAFNAALRDAQISPEQVDYYNAHATSTPLGDMAEVHGMQRVLPDPSKVYMNCTKSMIGHLLGAAGGIEAVVAIKALQTGKIHPTINLEDPEPGIKFQIPTEALEADVKVAISNSFGFGGHNATLIFGCPPS